MPRSVDIVIRNEMVDKVKPGDQCIFTGNLIVVPEVITLLRPGERKEVKRKVRGVKDRNSNMQGITGLKALGVREMNYKLIFLAQFAQVKTNRFGTSDIQPQNIDQKESEDSTANFTTDELKEIQ